MQSQKAKFYLDSLDHWDHTLSIVSCLTNHLP